MTKKEAKKNLAEARKRVEETKNYSDKSTQKIGAIKRLKKAEADYAEASKFHWANVGSYMNNAGMALMGVSVAMNMVSQGLRNAGLDGAADSFEKIS